MSKTTYLFGLLKHLFNKRISKFAIIDQLSTFHKTAIVFRGVKVVNSHIGAYTYITHRTKLIHVTIGNFCSIGPDCLIGLPRHPINRMSSSPLFVSRKNATRYSWIDNNTFNEFSQVELGSDIWIGSRSIIMGGVRIGHGAVIGAGAVVTRDIPDYAIAAGVPARVLKYRFEKPMIDKFLELEWWNKPEKYLRDNIHLFKIDGPNEKDLKDAFEG